MKFIRYLIYSLSVFLFTCNLQAAEKPIIRLAVLSFGTVQWELEALKQSAQFKNSEFELQIQTIATPQAGKIALQAGSVDMIVADWIWTAKMRATGSNLSFYPYSTTSGALMVANNSPINTLKDLVGKKLAIAGGELDKNWLLLQALAQQQQLDLAATITPVYGAPPLLNQELLKGRVDAVMNYWHFAARLAPQGYRKILDGKQILAALGIKTALPTLGYVFKQSWANEHKTALQQFFQASQTTKTQLCQQDSIWQQIVPLLKAKDIATQANLRQEYCAGQISTWGSEQQQAAAQVYQLLRKLSANKLTGTAKTLDLDIFWQSK